MMDLIILVAIAAVVVLAAMGAFAVAARRPPRRPSSRSGLPSKPAVAAPQSAQTPAKTSPKPRDRTGSTRVEVVESQRIVEIAPEEAGVTRRSFFNRTLAALFGSYLAGLGASMLAFFWPRLSAGFGARVDAGPVDDIKAQLTQPDGSVLPFTVSGARAYVVPISPAQLAGSQFEQQGLVADGLMVMWWRCVHLGCRVPWCSSSAGFECPCHGSKYNLFGEYEAGPAPRNLDRFVVEITENVRLMIDTGTIVQTARAPRKTVPYPQGPFCIGRVGE
ncbi:MAG: ubiquinol-cytochrome c reductase iron-sulfur subunit [Acidimicrobiia bacterium]